MKTSMLSVQPIFIVCYIYFVEFSVAWFQIVMQFMLLVKHVICQFSRVFLREYTRSMQVTRGIIHGVPLENIA